MPRGRRLRAEADLFALQVGQGGLLGRQAASQSGQLFKQVADLLDLLLAQVAYLLLDFLLVESENI